MRHFSSLVCTAFVLLFTSHPLPAQEWLQGEDVPAVMRRIFDYHVDEHELTPEVLSRSLAVYIDQFDPYRLYLLEEEVAPYLSPSAEKVAQMERDYLKGELQTYAELNHLLEKVIGRQRKIRQKLQGELEQLFKDERELEEYQRYPRPKFAQTVSELEQRVRDRLVRFIQSQREREGDAALEGRQEKVFQLYERNVVGQEDDYLGLDEAHRQLDGKEREHVLALRVLKSLAKSLDSHTAFFSAQEAYDMRVRLEKGFHGIGIVLQEGVEGITIVRLIEGGPAQRSGLIQPEDRIVEVDGVAVEGYAFDDVLDLIRGKEGSVIVLGLARPSQGQSKRVINVQLQREQITMNDKRVDVSYEEVEGGILGKITLYSFYDGDSGISSERDVRNAIRELYQIGNVKGLVLDLRENTGGFLMQAVKVAGLFITNGVVVISKYADDEVRYFRDIDGHAYYDGPLVILTSKASASAAEIVAQTLQDYGVALIVGDERTYGKGSIQHQTVTGRDSNSFFKVTVGRYYTVSGRSTQIRGVQADIVVPTEFNAEQLGEKFLNYPLAYEEVEPAFQDNLQDIDAAARRWYLKYYMPSLQQKKTTYRPILPVLRERSQARLEGNVLYQAYLKLAAGKEPDGGKEREFYEQILADPESMDPPLEEAVQIVRDMMLLLPNTGSMDGLFSKE